MPSHSELMTRKKVDSDKPMKPLGFYVLVEMVEVENVSSSGIYLGDQTRAQSAEEVGYLRAVGPTAYHGWEGCGPDIIHTPDKTAAGFSSALSTTKPYQKWGLELGDMLEFRAFEGKTSVVPDYERWRYIPDSHVVGVINRIDDSWVKVSFEEG